ncbi:uncharacterized protein KD926_003221 [Aspergillus affinis]|uniref:uncharacterized protein n=1 Tax=Aspergillus affinis TaxID=1070780 RepID=UPI0022FE7A83|nr:uncharacterized protein KD926_003221 [Aspergillus affinis]KAI9035592.1 hypothetical protein KD926_003221 [Aspergillus affinis]
MNPTTPLHAFARQGEPEKDPQDLQEDQLSEIQPIEEPEEGLPDEEELFHDSEQIMDDIDIDRAPITKERFIKEIKKDPNVVYKVMTAFHELEIKETNRAQKAIRTLKKENEALTAERDTFAMKWALSRDRTGTFGSHRSTKIPDPPMLSNGEDPTFENWQLAIYQKMTANADHYPTTELRIAYVTSRCERDARQHISPRLLTQNYRDFGEILSHLKSIFVDPNKARNARRKFNSIKMAAFKDYYTFASEFQNLAVERQIDRDTWKESFFFALPDEIQRMVVYVFNDDNRTFEDFTHECAKVADLWADLKKCRNNKNAARDSSKSLTSNKGASPRPAHYIKGEEKDQLMRERKYFICRQFGHLATDCFQKGSHSSQVPKRELKALKKAPEQPSAESKNEEA